MHLTPTPRQLNEPFLKVLRWGALVVPLPALTCGYAVGAGAIAFLLGSLVLILLAGWAVVGFNLVRHHFAERRASHEVLQYPKICKRLRHPRSSILVGGFFLMGGSFPFVLGATSLAGDPSEGAWAVAGVLMLVALLLQWVGWQRISDYLLVRRAWKEAQLELKGRL